jgi:phage terminase large subunit
VATVQVELPPKLVDVFAGEADYRGAYGGRGSAKTRSFAKMAAVWGLKWATAGTRGVIVCGREFMNSLAESSFAEIKSAIMETPWLAAMYDVGEKYIRTKDGNVSFEFVGLRHNLDSIKSKSRILLLWVDEAEPVSDAAWIKTIPTVREEGAEIWVTWNPEREQSATHKRFRLNPPSRSKIIEINYSDNPWFPASLDRKREDDKRDRPEQYDHIWMGGFKTVVEGAYFAAGLVKAKEQGRIGRVTADPLLPVRAYADIGGTSARSDAFVFWMVQFVGREIRVLDHYEAVGQEFGEHVHWLRTNGYERAEIVLPHDGLSHDKVWRVTPESFFREAGFRVRSMPNAGAGAASARVEAVRRILPVCWFNAETTEGGRQALGWYHEKRQEDRNIGLGPEHDWSSHSADAFGGMAMDYKPPSVSVAEAAQSHRPSWRRQSQGGDSWKTL